MYGTTVRRGDSRCVGQSRQPPAQCHTVGRNSYRNSFPHVMPRAAERRDGSAALSPVLRVSLAGILSTMADAVDESAFESLVDVFECYVRTIGSVGSQAAQHAGRTHANLSDALLGLSAVGAGPIAALRDLQRVAPDLGPAGHDALPQFGALPLVVAVLPFSGIHPRALRSGRRGRRSSSGI